MRKIQFLLIIHVIVFNVINGQVRADYDIYLMFDSSLNEMVRSHFGSNEDSISFIVTKTEGEILPYTLVVNESGKLNKLLKGNTKEKCCAMTFIHDETRHEKDSILKINNKINSILYEDFLKVPFNNFRDILQDAKKVFIIDIGENKTSSLYFTAYEVEF